MEKLLKGEEFHNRYRFTGCITTQSPLHIGTGEQSDAVYSDDEREELLASLDKVPLVSIIAKDAVGKPSIPGSTIRGVMRHWLLSVFSGVGMRWAATRDYRNNALTDLSQADQIQQVKEEFSMLELLFGTPFHEGKIEFWDANCTTDEISTSDSLLTWNPKSLTYIDTSVAIDPSTGTAIENLLYKAEVVPPGVKFEINIVGQNLSDEEIGMILFALEGFNSQIYPIRLGARGGRGYGRVKFVLEDVYFLPRTDLQQWVNACLDRFGATSEDDLAGYFSLPKLNEEKVSELLDKIRTHMKAAIGGQHE